MATPEEKEGTPVKEIAIEEGRPGDKGIERCDDLRNPGHYSNAVKAWLKKVNPTNEQFTATLFRYDPVNKTRQTVCDEREGEILSMDDIGMTFGAGDYRYLIEFPNGESAAGKINIDKAYDERRKRLQPEEAKPEEKKDNQLLESLALMSKLAEIMKSLQPVQVAPVAQADPGALMVKTYGMMQDVLKQNLLDTSGMYKKMMEEKIEGSDADDINETPEKEEGGGMQQLIMSMLEKYIPKLLPDSPGAKITAEMIRDLPEFKALLDNNKVLKSVVSEVKKKISPKDFNTVVKKLGIEGKV